jgi:hypothetical protein
MIVVRSVPGVYSCGDRKDGYSNLSIDSENSRQIYKISAKRLIPEKKITGICSMCLLLST